MYQPALIPFSQPHLPQGGSISLLKLSNRPPPCSDIFLKEAVRLMRERGYTIGNIDCTIIAQARARQHCLGAM